MILYRALIKCNLDGLSLCVVAVFEFRSTTITPPKLETRQQPRLCAPASGTMLSGPTGLSGTPDTAETIFPLIHLLSGGNGAPGDQNTSFGTTDCTL